MATKINTDQTSVTPFADHKLPDLLEKARAMKPLLREKSPEAERQRTPTTEVDQALRAMNAFSLIIPERLGGEGLSLSSFARIQMEISRGDPSMSWVVQILNGTTWISTLASDAIQDDLFGKGPVAICGAYNPPGIARKVDGGYIVNGAWPYTSGSRQADWAQCGVRLEGQDAISAPGITACYIPMSSLEIEQSWFVTGMQATGSDTTVAKDVFVPEHLFVFPTKPYGTVEPGMRNFGAASDYLPPVPSVRASGIAQLLGAAREMLDICEAESKKKPVVTTTFKTRTESAVYVQALGKVAAQLDTAEVLLFDMLRTLDDLASRGVKAPLEVSSRQRAGCAQVIELIHASVEQIMFISGSSAFALANPLSRYWRDVAMGLRHIQNIPIIGYEIYGRDKLGALPNIAPPGSY